MDWSRIAETSILNNTVGSYLQALVTFALVVAGFYLGRAFVVRYLARIAEKTSTDLDDMVVALVGKIGWPVFVTVALYAATLELAMPASLKGVFRIAMVIVVTIRVIVIIQDLLKYALRKFYTRRLPKDNPSGELIVNSMTGFLNWIVWVLGLVFLLDNLGVDISTFVAGIGIGGVAVALASQTLLGDAFSAFSIFLDRPFEIGDFVIVDDMLGTVEYIGVKTTRIRSLSGEQLVFSNSDLTKSRIKNYKRMQTRRIEFRFGIVYGTPVDKVKRVPEMVREIVGRIEGLRLDRAHFKQFGDFALIFEVVYFVNSPDYNLYMDRQQEINLRLMEALEKEGIGFAYPTQTLHVASMPSVEFRERSPGTDRGDA